MEIYLIVLYGFLIMAALVVTKNYKWLFWLTIFSLVIGPRRISFNIAGNEYDLVPVTVLCIIMLFFTRSNFLFYMVEKYRASLLAMLFSLATGAFWVNTHVNWIILWQIPLVSVFLMIFLCDMHIDDENDSRFAESAFIYITVVIAFFAVLAFFGVGDGRIIILPLPEHANLYLTSGKNFGIFPDSTVASVLPAAVPFILRKKNIGLYVKIFFITLLVVTVTISLKRVGYISLALVAAYLLASRVQERRYSRYLIVMLIAMVLASSWDTLIIRFSKVFEIFGVSHDYDAFAPYRDKVRLDRFNYVWSMIKKSPVLGNGSGAVIFSHYGFFELLANMGILGLAIIHSIFVVPLKILAQNIKKDNPSILDWAAAAVIFTLTTFSFEAGLNRPEHMVFLGFFLGMLRANVRMEQSTEVIANE